MKRLWCALSLLLGVWARAQEAVPVVEIRGSINISTALYLERALKEAKDAPALFIEMDTPGGFLESTREIVQLFLNSEKPIIVWVAPSGAHAASAGSMITMAAHFAAMAPSTSIGAATPIDGSGKDVEGDLAAKVKNDTVSFVRSIAEKRGRNAQWAEESVTQAASVTATQAAALKVVDGVYATRDEVWKAAAQKLSLPQNVAWKPYALNTQERLLDFVSNPNIAYGLLSLGALGIYVEMTHPGTLIPGAIGVVSLALGAITMKIIPIRPGALGLLVLGLVLLALEIFTAIPTYGVAGVMGLGALFLSGLFLLDPAQTNLTLDPGLWLPIFFVMSGLMASLGWLAMKALRATPYKLGVGALIGEIGEVRRLPKEGEALIQINGELWRALWDLSYAKDFPGASFRVGDKVRVTAQEGLTTYVVPAK